jgi:hypothetical protein
VTNTHIGESYRQRNTKPLNGLFFRPRDLIMKMKAAPKAMPSKKTKPMPKPIEKKAAGKRKAYA